MKFKTMPKLPSHYQNSIKTKIDNVFFDNLQYVILSIVPNVNGLSVHDALMLK